MARLQDFQTVTPTSSDKLLVVQSQGQGLVPYGSKLDSANPTGTGTLTMSGDVIINGSTSVSAGLKWGFYVPATTGSTVKINCGANYKILIIMGIFQQVGVKCFIVNISGGVLTLVKDLVTGDPFTNTTNLSFAFANQVLTITCVSGSHFNVYGEDISRGT